MTITLLQYAMDAGFVNADRIENILHPEEFGLKTERRESSGTSVVFQLADFQEERLWWT
jgi:hypothetical protein